MQKVSSFLAVLVSLAALLLAGCQYPMGLNKSQWQSLTPEQQAEYRRQQYQIDEQRRREREAEEQRRRQEAEERARIEQERLREAYARARYGDIVTVTIQGGTVNIGGRPTSYEPLRFDLIRSERRQIEFVQQGKASNRLAVDVRLSEYGNTFYFDEKANDRLALISAGWEGGKDYGPLAVRDPFSQSRAQDIKISLQLKRLPGAPPRPFNDERRIR